MYWFNGKQRRLSIVLEILQQQKIQAISKKFFFFLSFHTGDSQWPEALCFQIDRPSIPFLWMWYFKNALREFLQIWNKHSPGVKD